jgi:prevent-host-death family protein
MKKSEATFTDIGAYEAKTHLPELLRQVAGGARFRITNRGRPVAELVPVADPVAIDVSAAIDRFLAFKSAHPVRQDVSIKALIEEGRE